MDSELPGCPECGAPPVGGLNCWEQLCWILGWEGNDPELAAVHFLTVASYNLQHPAKFTDAAIAELWVAYDDYLTRGVTASELRRRASRKYEGATKVLRPGGPRRPLLLSWSYTVADVYQVDRPEAASERVKEWASHILRARPMS